MIRRIRLLSMLMTLWLVALARAQFDLPKVEPFGLDGFRLMLQQQGMETTQLNLASAMRSPEETVIVLIGDISDAMRIRSGLTAFVHNGGAMLVATDLGGRANRRAPWLYGSQFLYSKQSFPASERLQLQFSDCPKVTNFERGVGAELFEGVDTIVANRPGQLQLGDAMDGIAWLPRVRRSRQPAPLMAVNRIGRGRMLLVADHSIFINEMLIHSDNARFANNVTQWLTADGNRKRLVVCHDNRLLPEWSFRGTPPAIPLKNLLKSVEKNGLAGLPLGDALIPILNQSLSDFERNGGFNDMVHAIARSQFGRRPWRKPLIMLALLLLLIAARWIFGTRGQAQRWLFFQDKDPRRETRLTTAATEKQYQPYLRTLAREFFAESGITRFSERENYPEVQMQNRSIASKTANEIRAFWDIATSRKTGHLSQKKFQNMIGQLRKLHDLQAQGLLKLE